MSSGIAVALADRCGYRKLSAEYICQSILELRSHLDTSEILVLTPFREQRKVLRDRLSELGIQGVTVSTVHRAQGSERHTVFFDPVRGASHFLDTDNGGPELINVALSRAMARLVITLSPGDCENVILDWIAKATAPELVPDKPQKPASTVGSTLAEIVSAPDFPNGYVGKHVKYKGDDAQVLSVGEASFTLYIFKLSCEKKISTGWAKTHPSSL